MNEYDLFDAFGGVDVELLERSERRPVRRLPLRKALIAAAAVMALAVTAIAAPAIRALLFPSVPVLTNEGRRHIYGELYRSIENAEYRIELEVNTDFPLPDQIEEVRLPHYMIENDWLVSYGEIDAVYSEGPVHFKWWDRESPKWVTFEQLCIPSEGASFKLETYHGAELQTKTLTLGDSSIEYYNIPAYRNLATWESYPEATAVYWSDGEYAYHLECSSYVTEDELAQIVLSVEVVEDVSPYLKNDPRNDAPTITPPPLDVHRTPTFVPDGYELIICANDGYAATWIWENHSGGVISFTEAHGDINGEVMAREQYQRLWNMRRGEISLGDVTVHTYQYPAACELLWDDGSVCSMCEDTLIHMGHNYWLKAEGDSDVTMQVLLQMAKSVKEISDLSEYLTD